MQFTIHYQKQDYTQMYMHDNHLIPTLIQMFLNANTQFQNALLKLVMYTFGDFLYYVALRSEFRVVISVEISA